MPTLSLEEAHAYLLALLNDTMNCRLPCWLGITPGQSTSADAKALLESLSTIASKTIITDSGMGSVISIPYPNDNAVVEIDPNYNISSSNAKVSVGFIVTRANRYTDGQWGGYAFGYDAYNQLLKPYTLSGILSAYGQPTQIYIFGVLRSDTISSVSQTPDAMDRFFIHLVYPDQGILMEYEMRVEGRGDSYLFCPSKALITGYLMMPGNAEGFYNTLHSLKGDIWVSYPPDWVNAKTPEKAFGMTIEEFYRLFRSSPDSCLETPKSIWWPEAVWSRLSKHP
jgi:hypothetical protein